MASRSPELPATDLFVGETRIGAIVERSNGQYEAALSDGRSLGWFTGWQAAVHAILFEGRR